MITKVTLKNSVLPYKIVAHITMSQDSEKLNSEQPEPETDLRTWHLNNQDIASTPFSKKRQVLATFAVTLGCLLNGSVIGYTSPAIPSLLNPTTPTVWGYKIPVTFQQASWMTGQ